MVADLAERKGRGQEPVSCLPPAVPEFTTSQDVITYLDSPFFRRLSKQHTIIAELIKIIIALNRAGMLDIL